MEPESGAQTSALNTFAMLDDSSISAAGAGSFLDAVHDAIQAGLRETEQLDEVSERVGTILTRATNGHQDLRGQPTRSRQTLSDIAVDAQLRLTRHIAAQREVLSTYNIALFGRTGAGKSTLLTALGRLDGYRVSQGESDWTTKVEPIEWNDCLLYDTPGINGWGRTRSRDDLEDAARRAVEVSDVVVLCFDTQSQQASEFEKVSAWVRDYGKPVIAALNVRNLRWRHPAKVANTTSRARLSESVHQHAQNISDELERIGMPQTPVIAIQGKRALHARASQPFRGPDATNFEVQRKEHGIEYLERWSNITVLEGLITAMVRAGGADLRMTSLRGGVRSELRRIDRELREFETAAKVSLQALDRSVSEALDILGYPEQERNEFLLDDSTGTDLVTLAEVARGRPFRAPRWGRLDRQVSHLASSHLGRVKSDSLSKADSLINRAFDRPQGISESEFERTVFDRPAIHQAADSVWQQAEAFLGSELSLAASEGRTDLNIETRRLGLVEGRAGGTWRTTGTALRLGGLASGTASVFLGLAALNVWNPLGWGAGAVGLGLLGVGVLSTLLGWGGGRSQRHAEQQRLRARSQAIGRTHSAINDVFRKVRHDLTRDVHQEAWRTAADALRPMLEELVNLHTVLRDSIEARRQLSKEVGSIPDPPSARGVLVRAQALLLANAQPDDSLTGPVRWSRSIDHLLLGDDWIGDELTPVANRDYLQDHLHLLSDRERQERDRLRSALQAAWDPPDPQTARLWIRALARMANADPDIQQILEASQTILAAEKPSIVIVGDYSAGKTSFLKRILVESGRTPPDDLDVRGNPTTATTVIYELDRIQLIDTPGFQSGDSAHDEAAVDAVRKAALVVFLFHVNLLIGNTEHLRQVVMGSKTSVGKGPRTLFLINRCDELGPDPVESPVDYLQRKSRKEAELAAALAGAELPVRAEQILGIASDPFGQVGDTPGVEPSAYEEDNRSWDAIRPLREALLAEVDLLDTTGREISAIEYATSELMGLHDRLRSLQEELAAGIHDRRDLLMTLHSAVKEAQLLTNSLTQKVSGLSHEYANGCLVDALEAGGRESRARKDRFLKWWEDEPFTAELQHLLQDADENISRWEETYESAISRDLRDAERSVRGSGPSPRPGPEAIRDTPDIAGGAQRTLRVSLVGVNAFRRREVFYEAGKIFGVRFKPWGATKGAAKVGKFGPVLAAAGVILDGVAWWQDIRSEKQREAAHAQAIRWAADSADEVARQVLHDSGTGPVSYLTGMSEQLDAARSELEQAQADDAERSNLLEHRVDAIQELIKSAKGLVGTADGGRTERV